jgi:hypothetical protein
MSTYAYAYARGDYEESTFQLQPWYIPHILGEEQENGGSYLNNISIAETGRVQTPETP